MTAYLHLRGRQFVSLSMIFRERCFWKPREKGSVRDALGKLEPRWQRCIFLGFSKKTNEYILWDEVAHTVVTSRTVHRLVRGARFDGEALVQISQGPHDGHVAQEAPPVFQDMPPQAATEARPERPARSFDIFRRDAEKYGYTADGCPKCARAMRYGWDTAKQHSHSKKCRSRFEEPFRQSEDDKHRVNEADQRQNRRLA